MYTLLTPSPLPSPFLSPSPLPSPFLSPSPLPYPFLSPSSDAAYVIEDAWSNKDEQFVDQEVYGTPDYIAPEVIMGQPYGMSCD